MKTIAMKKLLALSLALLLVLGLSACTTSEAGIAANNTAGGETSQQDADTVTITHEYGSATLPVNPERIVVFDLGILDILHMLNIEIGGRPNANFPAHLSQYGDDNAYINTGSMKEADFEAINEYGPDVIFISGRMASAYDELSKIAPTVYLATPGSNYMEDFYVNISVLQQVFPKKAQDMQALVDGIAASVAELETQAQASGLQALVAMANDGSLSFFGSGSRYGVIHDTFGFALTDSDIEASTHGQDSTFEYIYEVNPDVLFVIDRSAAIGTDTGDTGAATLLDNDLVGATNAAQNGKIIYLSSDIWYLATGGIQSTQIMLEEVASALE